MKYTGRIVSLLIVMISSLGLIVYNYIFHGLLDVIHVTVSAFYLFCGWWLGKQYDKIKYLSEKDLLTECYTRRFVMDKFPKLKSISDRKGQQLILFLIDVNNFKSINDQHDHAMGDRVLQLIANTLKSIFRKSDYVVRWGGDEFLILLPCTDEARMQEQQSYLHHELQALSGLVPMTVTVSAGYAVYPNEGIGLDDLIKIADKKMYTNKYGNQANKERRMSL
ncbi:GGDEF domain-containing protein [Paenibacillus sp. UNC451MF]|uniref:GGDEF domain-containing protein n=1 Tax=Paenibacillus sp. UNC451MF TaxID=1449063 RepID=UPI00069068D8|nr:GGDEF domain-containing protein [Paenibacillus sp. UNC451MF]